MFVSQALRRLEKAQSEILCYKFKDPLLLLEAFTHRSGQQFYKLNRNYEKLELLGDAILDYLANSNLLRFTLFERYLEPSNQYRYAEDFNCADAHQAKIQLVKNDFIAKLTVMMGLHKYAIFYNSSDNELSSKDVDDYLKFSYQQNFDLNYSEIEPFEAPKILGDIFEAVMGAIFEDGGMDAIYSVYK